MNTMKNPLQTMSPSALPKDTTEAMAYVPFQPNTPELCKPVLGFENGTIFKALHKPFYGGKCGVMKSD